MQGKSSRFAFITKAEFSEYEKSYKTLKALARLYFSIDIDKMYPRELLDMQEQIEIVVKHKIDLGASAIAKVVEAVFKK